MNAPFRIAAEEETLNISELELRYQEVKVWSNHTVHAVRQMLFEQEKLDTDLVVEFYLECPEEESRHLEQLHLESVVKDVLPQWPLLDEMGRVDTVTIPLMSMQCRFKLKAL